jgi:hypothetical protein
VARKIQPEGDYLTRKRCGVERVCVPLGIYVAPLQEREVPIIAKIPHIDSNLEAIYI